MVIEMRYWLWKACAWMKVNTTYCVGLVACLLISCHSKPVDPPPRAAKGLLDLRHWNFSQEPITLNGEWEFYWQQCYEPSDFNRNSPGPARYLPVPDAWNSYQLDGLGFATYRLRALLDSAAGPLALRLPLLYTSSIVWVNGRIVYRSGIVGRNAAVSLPAYQPQVVDIALDKPQLEIVIQVSNFHYSHGGIRRALELGRQVRLREDRVRAIATDFWLMGSILIMALYHLGLFFIRRQDSAPLYFGLFCGLIALRIMITGEYTVHWFVQPNWQVLIRLEYLTFTLGVAFFTAFVYSVFYVGFPRLALRVILAVAAGFSLMVLVSESYFFTGAIVPFQAFTAFLAVYLLFLITKACWLKREGSMAFLGGYLILMAAFFNDLLQANAYIQNGQYISVGLFLFIFSQAFLLARRFSRAFTELRTSNEKLSDTNALIEEQNEELKRLNAELDSFVYRTSHDLRSPIASVLGLIDIASREEDLGQIRHYMSLQEQALHKLDGVISSIIAYAKNKSWPLEVVLIDFESQVRESFDSHRYMAQASRIDLRVAWQAGTAFYSDRRRIDIVLNNLISNAIRYGNPYQEQPFIEVTVRTDHQKACLEVRDNGLGIARQYQDKIFEMFFRLNNEGNGSGLGLYVVRETVHKLGGRISVESVVNQGTVFRIELSNLPFSSPK